MKFQDAIKNSTNIGEMLIHLQRITFVALGTKGQIRNLTTPIVSHLAMTHYASRKREIHSGILNLGTA